jgi:hypothetical protein
MGQMRTDLLIVLYSTMAVGFTCGSGVIRVQGEERKLHTLEGCLGSVTAGGSYTGVDIGFGDVLVNAGLATSNR